MSFGAAGAVFDGGAFDDIFIDGFFQETPSFSGFSGEVRATGRHQVRAGAVDVSLRRHFGGLVRPSSFVVWLFKRRGVPRVA
jgi:hypothetical protein